MGGICLLVFFILPSFLWCHEFLQLLHVHYSGADPGFGQGGPQLVRPKVADVAKRIHMSKGSNLQPGSRACSRALEAFGFLMLKYAFSHILETLFL